MFGWLSKKKEETKSESTNPAELPVAVNEPLPPVGSVSVTRPTDLPLSNHFASRNRTLMVQEYEYLWPQARVKFGFGTTAQEIVMWARNNRLAFEYVRGLTNIPWWVIAGISQLEMGCNFNGTILNGDPWKEKTKHYPSGLGPWKSWADAAIWGLRHEAKGWNIDLAKYRWDVGGCFYFAECYNGHDARLAMGSDIIPPNASPYIYSATQFYEKGKFTEVESPPGSGKYVGMFRPDLVSQQVGFMAFARAFADSGEVLFP